MAVGVFGGGLTAWLPNSRPSLSIGITMLPGAGEFWFVPELLEKHLHSLAPSPERVSHHTAVHPSPLAGGRERPWAAIQAAGLGTTKKAFA